MDVQRNRAIKLAIVTDESITIYGPTIIFMCYVMWECWMCMHVNTVCNAFPFIIIRTDARSLGRSVVRSIGSVCSFVSKSQPVFIGDISFRCDIVFALIEIDLIKYRLFIWFCVHNIAICTNLYIFFISWNYFNKNDREIPNKSAKTAKKNNQ